MHVGVGARTANTFGSIAPPTNYVAGLGRGAVGFTTRSDIGPARSAPATPGAIGVPGAPPIPVADFGQAPAGYVAGAGRGAGGLLGKKPEDAERSDLSETNYDQFSGYSQSLFNDTPYDRDDEEADRIYEAIDTRMDSRRKKRRESKMLEAIKKFRQEKPKISDQFVDLKKDIAELTAADWEGIPDVGDYSLLYKQKKRNDIYTPLPDHIIEGARGQGSMSAMLDPKQQKYGGLETPVSGTVSATTGLAGARGTVLSLKLDKMSDSVEGQTVVDPKGYLTDLNSLKISSDAEIGDIEKARLLLSSVRKTNPKHGPAWIASARVEEYAAKIIQARKLIREGCEACPDAEDVWLEAARLHPPENAKTILANAVRHLPTSVKIWLKAADLETTDNAKKIVLRRALELVPNSVKLWKTAIELENVVDARIMLGLAVERVPHSVDMWLALARLETYENARKVLNQAREALPTEPAIWLTAAKLEEAQGNVHMVDRIVEKAVASLSQYQVVIDREQWLKEAETAEKGGAPLTCGAIVRATLPHGVEPEDRKRTWLDDAESAVSHGAVETARAIYAYALSMFSSKKSIWLRACSLEKKFGTKEALEGMLKKAVSYCPQAEILWLMAAKEKWLTEDVSGARSILMEAFAANPDSEQIWLAAVKLEWENNEPERARILLRRARDKAPTERVWMKSALLERELGEVKECLEMLDYAIGQYPSFAKFYMMAGQACDEALGDFDRARNYYQTGLRRCPMVIPLWRLASRLEEKITGVTKARSVLELARLKNPKNAELWVEAIRLERRQGNEKLAENLAAKAIQDCPNSGILWAEEITSAPRHHQKAKSVEALKRCDNDPFVVTAVARLFQNDRKYAKARKWFNRAVALDADLGDSWAYFYAFELRQGTPAEQEALLARCVAAEPSHGELWCTVAKKTENRRCKTDVVLKKVVAKLSGTVPNL